MGGLRVDIAWTEGQEAQPHEVHELRIGTYMGCLIEVENDEIVIREKPDAAQP